MKTLAHFCSLSCFSAISCGRGTHRLIRLASLVERCERLGEETWAISAEATSHHTAPFNLQAHFRKWAIPAQISKSPSQSQKCEKLKKKKNASRHWDLEWLLYSITMAITEKKERWFDNSMPYPRIWHSLKFGSDTGNIGGAALSLPWALWVFSLGAVSWAFGWDRINFFLSPKSRVSCPGFLAILSQANPTWASRNWVCMLHIIVIVFL